MDEKNIGREFAQVLTEPVRAQAQRPLSEAMMALQTALPGFGIRIEVSKIVEGVPPPYRQAIVNKQYDEDTKGLSNG